MNESYAETSVKCKATAVTYLVKTLMVVAMIACLAVMFLGGFFGVLGAALIVFIGYMFPKLSVIYEYIFCDGQLDFDKIMGGAKRKQIMRVDFDQVEIVAKANSHALDGYTYVQTEVKNFTSRDKNVTPYVIIVNTGEKKTKIMFEPSDKMLAVIKQKYPRKISMI